MLPTNYFFLFDVTDALYVLCFCGFTLYCDSYYGMLLSFFAHYMPLVVFSCNKSRGRYNRAAVLCDTTAYPRHVATVP